ncbi:DUF192 domain-containing protein [Erythrobacter sp. YJ-T3-07]|uniref:DUF192 domain-containing protein n=1 Tax=Erythrobacter sp. YJ-T3-07 TaxID=2793063 RepID=UPI001F2648A0|nr:DUF192 domain-containing protein [Erythrobacter sp. YJ-T3-07]
MGIGRWVLSGAAMLLMAGCSPQTATDSQATGASAAAERTVHPESGLEIVPVTISTDKGEHRFAAEVAATQEEQARGLMFRTQLGPDEAMIFPRQGDVASFWMKNTPLPLDIIFIGQDRKIINIAAQTTPYSLDSVSALGPTSAVLEIPGGRAAELGIGPGDAVEW